VGWALEQQPELIAQVVQSELERGPVAPLSSVSPDDAELLAHGVVPEGLRNELRKTAFRDVITPCASALLARTARPRPENPVLSA
jgi:hypothetical protein